MPHPRSIPGWPKQADGWLSPVYEGTAVLRSIKIPPEQRGKGLAKKAMTSLTRWADRRCVRLALTPSGTWGASERRLVAFYRSYGFVPNRGRRRAWEVSEEMIRVPRCK